MRRGGDERDQIGRHYRVRQRRVASWPYAIVEQRADALPNYRLWGRREGGKLGDEARFRGGLQLRHRDP